MTLSLALLGAALTLLPGATAQAVTAPDRAARRASHGAGSLPLALDLVSTTLRAGRSVAAALEAAAPAAPHDCARQLAHVAALLRLGADPPEAWAHLDAGSPLAEVARVAGRSSVSGARLAEAFAGCATRLRRSEAADDEARAQRAGVLCALPLAVCFLPSFVCLGVVPTLLGLLAPAFRSAF
jgi:Flp pilus assembly protein TadB